MLLDLQGELEDVVKGEKAKPNRFYSESWYDKDVARVLEKGGELWKYYWVLV